LADGFGEGSLRPADAGYTPTTGSPAARLLAACSALWSAGGGLPACGHYSGVRTGAKPCFALRTTGKRDTPGASFPGALQPVVLVQEDVETARTGRGDS